MKSSNGHYQKMSPAEFRSVVADYAATLPGWERTKKNTFERTSFPVRQVIWFDRLSSGNYRPTNSVSAVPFGVSSVVHETLDVRHRQSTYREHRSRWEAMAREIKRQFIPAPEREMDLNDLLVLSRMRMAEISAPHPSHLLFEGILAAWLGDLEAAARSCGRAIEFTDWMDRPEPEWLTLVREQARELLTSIHSGCHRELLISANESAG